MLGNTTGIRTGYLCGKYQGKIGHLHSPRTKCLPPGPFDFCPYALDNGAFKAGDQWEPGVWIKMLEWAKLSGQRPLWALVPDVVGSRDRTLQAWDRWAHVLAQYGWPLAMAVQDGMMPHDVPKEAEVVFIGGTTEWKWHTLQMWCAHFKRVHVGRVNSYRRLWQCQEAGAESCDGNGWFMDIGEAKYRGLIAFLMENNGDLKRIIQMKLEA